jgi:L-2,4-diaminobutyrate decarboxylase
MHWLQPLRIAKVSNHFFLNATAESIAAFESSSQTAVDELKHHYLNPHGVYSGERPDQAALALAKLDICPETGVGTENALHELAPLVLGQSLRVFHPGNTAHLHCPVLIPALAAEQWIAATNPSMDSWDQAPISTTVELAVCRWLSDTIGYNHDADGVFVSGGTQANFMGLLLARNHYAGFNINEEGLPPEAQRWRIICTPYTHFSIQKSLAQLGLGGNAAFIVEADADRRMNPHAAQAAILKLKEEGYIPIAIAATAGTTDYGSIDPLHALADLAETFKLWLHVDAAYAGALLLSEREKPRLSGIERADSVTIDFHKLFFQPISCSAFLVRLATSFDLIRYHADYLNPEEDTAEGFPNLVFKSIQTTRRFDALKVWMSLRAIGKKQFSDWIEHLIDMSTQLAQAIHAKPRFVCLHPKPQLTTVLFRYATEGIDPTFFHRQLAEQLLLSGIANLGITRVDDQPALKFTLLNPCSTLQDYLTILDKIEQLAPSIMQDTPR